MIERAVRAILIGEVVLVCCVRRYVCRDPSNLASSDAEGMMVDLTLMAEKLSQHRGNDVRTLRALRSGMFRTPSA